ncbi:MAG: TraR/DksA C4-type zinc finger protein [Acidimicrobiia bacterium]|nr:TraR/DksA C4-type zinc finger protein [Acidimicrobiia bacterium]
MTRKLAASTLDKFRGKLEDERQRLSDLLAVHAREREEARLSETSSERIPDPTTAEGGSMAFEYEKELSVDQNLEDLLAKVNRALVRMDEGGYGICEVCGEAIPFERLDVLPHATMCVTDAARAR